MTIKRYNHGTLWRRPLWVNYLVRTDCRFEACFVLWFTILVAIALLVAAWCSQSGWRYAFLFMSMIVTVYAPWISLAISWIDRNDYWEQPTEESEDLAKSRVAGSAKK